MSDLDPPLITITCPADTRFAYRLVDSMNALCRAAALRDSCMRTVISAFAVSCLAAARHRQASTVTFRYLYVNTSAGLCQPAAITAYRILPAAGSSPTTYRVWLTCVTHTYGIGDTIILRWRECALLRASCADRRCSPHLSY